MFTEAQTIHTRSTDQRFAEVLHDLHHLLDALEEEKGHALLRGIALRRLQLVDADVRSLLHLIRDGWDLEEHGFQGTLPEPETPLRLDPSREEGG